jgi:flavin reductase (DIM6/NTAB) family NADH-FMN oxidoreductase RutF
MAVVGTPSRTEFNVLPLCFHTWCSYSPLLYCVAIHNTNYSSQLFRIAQEFVLAIPGEGMIDQVMYCGTHSGRDHNKARECGIEWLSPGSIGTPGISQAMANLEVGVTSRVPAGDHILVVGEVLSMRLSRPVEERPLLAVGPASDGFEVLARSGIHTIAVLRDASHNANSGIDRLLRGQIREGHG